MIYMYIVYLFKAKHLHLKLVIVLEMVCHFYNDSSLESWAYVQHMYYLNKDV